MGRRGGLGLYAALPSLIEVKSHACKLCLLLSCCSSQAASTDGGSVSMAHPIRYRSLQDHRGVSEVHLLDLALDSLQHRARVPRNYGRAPAALLPGRIFGKGCSSDSGDDRNNVGS